MYISSITEVTTSELYMHRRLVELAVDRIFSGDLGVIDEYFNSINEGNMEEQLLAFHTDPLSLAAELCERVVTKDNQQIFEKLRNDLIKRIGEVRIRVTSSPSQSTPNP